VIDEANEPIRRVIDVTDVVGPRQHWLHPQQQAKQEEGASCDSVSDATRPTMNSTCDPNQGDD